MSWGPFAPSLDALEVKARIRVLRMALRALAGPAGDECRNALLVALIDPSPEALAAAADAFERLPAIVRRRTLSAYQAEATEVRT